MAEEITRRSFATRSMGALAFAGLGGAGLALTSCDFDESLTGRLIVDFDVFGSLLYRLDGQSSVVSNGDGTATLTIPVEPAPSLPEATVSVELTMSNESLISADVDPSKGGEITGIMPYTSGIPFRIRSVAVVPNQVVAEIVEQEWLVIVDS